MHIQRLCCPASIHSSHDGHHYLRLRGTRSKIVSLRCSLLPRSAFHSYQKTGCHRRAWRLTEQRKRVVDLQVRVVCLFPRRGNRLENSEIEYPRRFESWIACHKSVGSKG